MMSGLTILVSASPSVYGVTEKYNSMKKRGVNFNWLEFNVENNLWLARTITGNFL